MLEIKSLHLTWVGPYTFTVPIAGKWENQISTLLEEILQKSHKVYFKIDLMLCVFLLLQRYPAKHEKQ